MAYCKECGAYIPDGQENCLACGYDPSKEKKNKSKTAGGKAYEFNSESLKEELEKQRQRIREESQKWARQEAERRKAERETAQNDAHASDAAPEKNGNGEGSRNLLSAVSYLGILFLIPSFFGDDSKYTKFHIRQGIKLFVFGIISDIITGIIPVGFILSLARLYLIYKGVTNALNGRMEPLPYIGTIGEK